MSGPRVPRRNQTADYGRSQAGARACNRLQRGFHREYENDRKPDRRQIQQPFRHDRA